MTIPPLIQAASEGNNSELRLLLSEGEVDVVVRDNGGFTALQSAAIYNNLEAVQILMAARTTSAGTRPCMLRPGRATWRW